MTEKVGGNGGTNGQADREKQVTILVCDDEPLLRKTVARDLAKAGYSVLEAQTAESAEDLLEHRMIDLLITDVRLPGMSGWDLLDRTRARLSTLPVIVMSAYGSGGYQNRKGQCVFLNKPFAMEMLRTEVRKALRSESGASLGGAL